MVQKKIDSRIKTLIENNAVLRHRGLFVLIGDKGKDQVVQLHYMLSKATHSRPSVLWCYKKELGFTSHRQKRMKQIKKAMQRGLIDPEKDDPFELFISSTDIRYTYYKESEKVLGNTFGMCILQDFEALTPNLLARTIETVEGGGIVVLLLQTLTSLKQLYHMTMDVHSRYRTEAHADVVGRFNERFLLSLTQCSSCLMLDDQWNVLPFSKHVKTIAPLAETEGESSAHALEEETAAELEELKSSLADTQPAGSLISQAKTLDQAKALLTFIDSLGEKTLKNTVALTAARGRGKSAALGLSIAAAIAFGYSNIFVTSPSPENLKTLFEFVKKGLQALNFEEHMDYDVVESTVMQAAEAVNSSPVKSIVRLNIHKNHRQTIQYIAPQDAHVLGQAELLVIDEAAAIPLPMVKKLLGPYVVFMASTIHGYEGTGRSLSLKLLSQLREHSATSVGNASAGTFGRKLREVKLDTPIRYGPNDPVEGWLNKLLCLDANVSVTAGVGTPLPTDCELYYVQRDTLFSHHKASETFLQKMMALYVSSHYKNSPNDLQLMSDAPAHQLFVLLAPQKPGSNSLPEILVVLQVCLEGEISKASIMNSLARGMRASGDMIPWTMSQQFQESKFSSLSGARVVRIATHPDFQKMGYGARALELLEKFYSGEIPFTGSMDISTEAKNASEEIKASSILSEIEAGVLKPKTGLPPLLLKLNEVGPSIKGSPLHWLGVSYGLTAPLMKFWKRNGFSPVYLRQTANELTGEYTCIMLKNLMRGNGESKDWLASFVQDFKRRLLSLLSYPVFHNFGTAMIASLLEEREASPSEDKKQLTLESLILDLSPYDLKRLSSYANNMVDFHLILDLLPMLSRHYLLDLLPSFVSTEEVKKDGNPQEEKAILHHSVTISPVQKCILLAMGCQRKSIEEVASELKLPVSQVLAMLVKLVRKFSTYYENFIIAVNESKEGDNKKAKISTDNEMKWDPVKSNLNDELSKAGASVVAQLNSKLVEKENIEANNDEDDEVDETAESSVKRQMIEELVVKNAAKFEIAGDEKDWNQALSSRGDPSQVGNSTLVSIPVVKKKKRDDSEDVGIAEKERQAWEAIKQAPHQTKKSRKGGKK